MRPKNSLVINNLKQKISGNTEYEYEHIFENTDKNYFNLKKVAALIMKIKMIF